MLCFLGFKGCIKMVNLQGRLKSNRKLSAELTFNFQIEAIGECTFVVCVRVCARGIEMSIIYYYNYYS